MSLINIVWVSFLSLIVLFFVVQSLFSKSEDSEVEEEYTDLKKSTKVKSKPKIRKSTKKKPKKDEKKHPTVKPTLKSKAENKPKDKPKAKKNKSKSKAKPKAKNKKPNPKVDPKPESKPKKKREPVEVREANMTFRGNFNRKEINLIKSFNVKNRGYVMQSHNNKIVFKSWIKTQSSLRKFNSAIEKDKSSDGPYLTYLIWNGEVSKFRLRNRLNNQ